MKYRNYSKIVFTLVILVSYVNSEMLMFEMLKKEEKKPEDDISDKELEELLKDPKYASLAGDLLVKDGPKGEPKPDVSSSKHPVKDLLHVGKSRDYKKSQSSKLLNMDLLIDPLKNLDLLEGSAPKTEENNKQKIEVDDKFKGFDFITKQQARYLIEILKQPVFLNMLPADAQQIVHVKWIFKYSQ